MPGPIYQFGDFQLDCGAFELQRSGRALRIERKPMELLILLASREGQLVTRTEIAQRLWSTEVFVDTEHGINTAIRKLRHLMHDDPDEPKFILTVTGLGYRFVAPVTVIAPEPGPASLPATVLPISADRTHLDRSLHAPAIAPEATPLRADRRLWIGIAVAGAVISAILAPILGPLAVRLFRHHATPAINSIAVLPIDNLSGDPNQEYFADGMTDELITMLARESTLRVTSRTSAMQYKGARRPLPEIARALNVDAILEGSVTRSGNQVHMTLQLIRADTDSHLWAQSYDRAANDAGTLPDEAAREIARRLNVPVPAPINTRYVNPAAHDAYLHGLYIWYTGSNEKAGEYFRKAVEIQPDYALGLCGLAAYYGAGAIEGELDPRDALPKTEALAAKAIALDDSLPEAHLAMAAAVYTARWDWKWSEREIRRALQLNPNFAEAWHLYAKMLGPLNRESEAIAAQRRGIDLDPFQRPWALAAVLSEAHEYDACLAEADLRLETYPHDGTLHGVKADCYLGKGKTKESVGEMMTTYKEFGDPESAAAVDHAFARGGIKAVTRWQLSVAERSARKQYCSPVFLAEFHAKLGEREPTLTLLEKGFQEHSPLLLWIQRDPAFDFLHGEPRYRSLIQRIGLPPAY